MNPNRSRLVPALLLLAASSSGQPKLANILRDLSSSDATRVAWAAHRAAEYDQVRAVPAIVKALTRLAPHDLQDKVHDVEFALVDSLIRLRAQPAPEVIQKALHGNLLPALMVLMARDPRRYEQPLCTAFEVTAHRKEMDPVWLAAGNLLVTTKSRRFAGRILGDLELTAHYFIVDRGTSSGLRSERPLYRWASMHTRRFEFPTRFAPFGFYTLEFAHPLAKACTGGPPRRLLTKGIYEVYYRRHTRAGGDVPLPRSFPDPDYDACRLAWLAKILDVQPRNLPVQAWMWGDLEFRSAEDYQRQVARRREKLAGGVRAIGNRLRAAGVLMPEDVAKLDPKINLRLEDRRRNRKVRLPELPGVELHR
jgi:hypothetical protein